MAYDQSTYEWDGSTWTSFATSPFPWIVFRALAFDPSLGRVVADGGSTLFAWDGAAWTAVSAAAEYPQVGAPGLVEHVPTGEVVGFGGFGGFDPGGRPLAYGGTMLWDGLRWRRAPVAIEPRARGGHGMVYDAARQRIALYGGNGSFIQYCDHWEWDGAGWTEVTQASTPRLDGVRTVYDGSNNRLILVGRSPLLYPSIYET